MWVSLAAVHSGSLAFPATSMVLTRRRAYLRGTSGRFATLDRSNVQPSSPSPPLQSSAETPGQRRPDGTRRLLSWDPSTPLRRTSRTRPLPAPVSRCLRPLAATLGVPFHPRGFSPPRRLAPCAGPRACCIPLPTLGFAAFHDCGCLPPKRQPCAPFPATPFTPLEGPSSPIAAPASPQAVAPLWLPHRSARAIRRRTGVCRGADPLRGLAPSESP